MAGVIAAGALIAGGGFLRAADAPRTLCNPLNLDYGWAGKARRDSADPVIVLFKERYCLFATDVAPGYRVSNDEDCRTGWPAQAGNAGEWFQMDLGKATRVKAVQVNFARQDCATEGAS